MRFKNSSRNYSPAPAKVKQEPLGDQRYQELVARAAAFFAESERDVEAERAAALTEILALMDEYGLTPDDLRD